MSRKPSFWLSSRGLPAIGLIIAAGYFLIMEHGEHLYPFLPYLILLLCPLMHIFMHRGHGHNHSQKSDHTGNKDPSSESMDDDYRRGYQDALKKNKEQK